MAGVNFKDHFSGGSADYAAYRPGYPVELADVLATISPGRDRALDCGCGTGQLSVVLAERFNEVIATDASATQIEKAQPHKWVTYRIALAENSGLPDASVDLITVAQAAHWFDLARFYAEARRVARPQAAIALISYGVLQVEGTVDCVVQHYYHEALKSYWPAERRHVEQGYRQLPFPFLEYQIPQLMIAVEWQLEDLVGYVGTWSAVKAASKAQGVNSLIEFQKELIREWGDPQVRRRVTWPLIVRAGNISVSVDG
ncbi:class I SAM-dependent methyltransferase [Planctomicrobium sp. SH527]|uniref:class I SAM-dependent methyltransferase n=1 Tax=Planctomicrobium sp. SH527 TaxID=3448123 RepID=UPI003F5C8C51